MRGVRLAGCLAALGALGIWGIRSYLDAGSAAGIQPRAAVPVRTALAEVRALPVYVRGIGHVVPENQVQVRSRVDGQIERVLYVEGQEVVARIDIEL